MKTRNGGTVSPCVPVVGGYADSMAEDRTAIDFALSLVADGTLRIDDDGSIWRTAVIARGKRREVSARRAENVAGKGYLRLTLQLPTARRLVQVMAHRLVWEALREPIPDGLQINHKDLDKTNNRIGNLEVTDGAGNIRHSYANGRKRPWSSATSWRGRGRVSVETMAAIREARAGGALLKDIAARFEISVTHAHKIATG